MSSDRAVRRGLSLALALTWILRSPGALSAAEMAVSLDRDSIYLGTQTVLTVQVANAKGNEVPVVSPVDGLTITPYGTAGVVRDLFSGSIQRNYRFLIEPVRAGEFQIPAVTIGTGAGAATQGPFKLRVQEAPLKFITSKLEPEQIRIGERASLTLVFQGYKPGKPLTLPMISGLSMRAAGPPRLEMTRAEGLPMATYLVEVTAVQNGSYQLKGISLEGAAADANTLLVSPYVIAGVQVGDASLLVGDRTVVRLGIRGLPPSADVKLIAPSGLKIERSGEGQQSNAGLAIFTYNVVATEPGSPVLRTVQLPDGTRLSIPKPPTLSVRRPGKPEILAARGAARSAETIVGEPFMVDYEVFFRGEFQAAGIDLGKADFAGRSYIKVEPVNHLSYKDWDGQAMEVGFSEKSRATMLAGSGEWNGQKEQMLRFALKVTPLAAGDVDLKGVQVIVRLMVREQGQNGGMIFSSQRSQDFARVIDAAAHRVIDPPGKRQPPGYHGAVGSSFAYVTSLDRNTATAMSPLTLTMKITGESVGPQFKPPALAEIPEFIRDFDISADVGGGEVQNNTITFTQIVRPRSEAVKELPALPLVYYDYVKKDYETVYSLPIPIKVTPGSLVGASAMQLRSGQDSGQTGSGAPSPPDEAVALGANHNTLGEVQAREPLSPAGVMSVLMAGPLAVGGVWALLGWRERRRPRAARQQQRRELKSSLDGLAGADAFYARLADLVQSYLRLTFGLPPGEVSVQGLAGAVRGKALPVDVQRTIEGLLDECDTGRFAAAGVTAADQTRAMGQARQLFERLDGL